MKKKGTKRGLVVLSAVFMAMVLISSEAFPWGWAVHTYVDDHIGKKRALPNSNEIYGGMAADAFLYMFSTPDYLAYLSNQTHNEFMQVWNTARWGLQKSLAFGFVSHNDQWGADSTAHHSGRTFGQAEGYVIAKAQLLKPILLDELAILFPGFPNPGLLDAIALEVSHELVENGVDILMKRVDRSIGLKITSAALFRSPEFPFLLARAYAPGFSDTFGIPPLEAARIIISAEKEFRKSMILYGQILMQDEATALQLVSEQTAGVAAGFLAANGIELPEDTDITPLVQYFTELAMSLCADDFATEVDATTSYVSAQMKAHGISY
ncbi:MAG: hypothetical protein EHM36_08205 [Deltaproteobacteria bacterium]|nr:MAG: hypothetical protein EHM36_08205 [Deltaproteobacteria bacterium]